MKEIAKKEAADNKVNLRYLDDTECANIVVSRQIRKMISKFPSMRDMAMDCWIHDGHYTRFLFKGGKFIWSAVDGGQFINGCETVTDDDGILDKFELNKIINFTFGTMCDSQDCVDLVDTPEDLLAFAETKLQEMLHDQNLNYAKD